MSIGGGLVVDSIVVGIGSGIGIGGGIGVLTHNYRCHNYIGDKIIGCQRAIKGCLI